MISVTLYTKPGCGLCQEVVDELDALAVEFPHQVNEVNILDDPKLFDRYQRLIPVVLIGQARLVYPFSSLDLRAALQQTLTPQAQSMTSKPVTGRQRDLVIWLDKRLYELSRNWLAVFNAIVLIYVGLPFLAPVFMKAGLTIPANVIYTAYSPLCHQFAFRSWFLFGQKAFYEASDPIWRSLGMNPYDFAQRWDAKTFIGNDSMGFKVAYCERDVAIYGAIFIGGIVYGLVRRSGRRIRPVHWLIYGLIGIGPIALDGFSQLFSQAPFHLIPLRESTPLLRTLTGFLFGVMNVWLAYPYVEESFAEIKNELEVKLSRIGVLRNAGIEGAGGND